MNIFMPETSIEKSVSILDDKRLIKQILECYQIVNINDRLLKGEQKVGYANHPVVKFYRDKRKFVIKYGYEACVEYWFRFGKNHAYHAFFSYECLAKQDNINDYDIIYIAKPNTDECTIVNHIIEKQNDIADVCKAFRKKLINKWQNDKRQPKWSNHNKPYWYKGD